MKTWHRRLERWLTRRLRPQRTLICLDRRHIYILPTGLGYVFALMLVVMFLWAVNYNNNMSFALTFLLSAVALNSMWLSYRTLVNLTVHLNNAEPVFAGHRAQFILRLENPSRQARYGIALQHRADPPQYIDIPPHSIVTLMMPVAAEQRGVLRLGRLRVSTCFPLGLFRAWSWIEFAQVCIVYPRPQGARPLPLQTSVSLGSVGAERGVGSEDYAGLQSYRPGDAPRHVAWKAAARTGTLLVKRFTDRTFPELWLDWQLLASLTVESRLSQLCQWVLKAETTGWEYGLRLPGLEYPLSRGEGHRRRCLEALARHGLPAFTKDADG